MTKLLEEVIERLRQLPESMQNKAARTLLLQIEEEPEPGDIEAIEVGWDEYRRGEFITLDQLRRNLTE